MSEKRKYLGKKRQKIFNIEKSFSQKNSKNSTIEKVNLSPIERLFSSEEIPTIKSSKLNLNLLEKNEKNILKLQKHSLINISSLVYQHLKTIIHTTGNEVTSHIKNIIQEKTENQPNQKNIQRRVYDAINVMCAVGLIKKNKQEIEFINYQNQLNNANNVINLSEVEEEKVNEYEQKIKAKNDELEEKRKILIKKYLTLKFYEKYSKLNQNNPQRQLGKKVEFPFELIQYDNSTPLQIKPNQDSSRYLLLSNSEFIHLTPYDIIKRLIAYDILVKLNDNINNISENKSNRKSTIENSLLDDPNYNYNKSNSCLINLEKTINKNQEFPRKKNLFSSDNNSNINTKDKSDKKNKSQKEHDFAFDYLKNIKIFVDELTSCNIHKKEANNEEINEEIKQQEEEQGNNFEKDNNKNFFENRARKNSDLSNWSNYNEENEFKKNNEDLISEIENFMQIFK